jgi:hypothetical protein
MKTGTKTKDFSLEFSRVHCSDYVTASIGLARSNNFRYLSIELSILSVQRDPISTVDEDESPAAVLALSRVRCHSSLNLTVRDMKTELKATNNDDETAPKEGERRSREQDFSERETCAVLESFEGIEAQTFVK